MPIKLSCVTQLEKVAFVKQRGKGNEKKENTNLFYQVTQKVSSEPASFSTIYGQSANDNGSVRLDFCNSQQHLLTCGHIARL